MYEEQRLISIGFPLEDALCICHAMRKENRNSLEDFVKAEEERYRLLCKKAVAEIID